MLLRKAVISIIMYELVYVHDVWMFYLLQDLDLIREQVLKNIDAFDLLFADDLQGAFRIGFLMDSFSHLA